MVETNLFSRLSAHFPSDPSAPFAELTDGRRYSYGDLIAVTGRFAAALQAMGVQPGDRVAVQVEKSIEAFMLYLATVRAGAIFLPLNTAYTPAEVDYFLTDARPALFVCAPGRTEALRARADAAGARLETMGVWRAGAPAGEIGSFFAHVPETAEFRTVERAADDIATILYTSGTTGRSKGAMTTQDNLYSNAVTLAEYWGYSEGDVLLHALPIFHTHGLFTSCNTVLASGSSLIWLPRFDADEIIARLPQATSMMGVPTYYTRLLDHPGFTRGLVGHMRLFTSGSAPMLTETHERFRDLTGQTILERYGMTETQMNTSNPYEGERRPGTVGFPLPGVELRIAEPESGRVVAAGEVGMIEVRGPNVFKGYWQMPEKTAEEFRSDGFFITGDLGTIDERGYVSIVGRAKDLVISGGYNVYPKEIEGVIDDLPGVLESAVIGVPHPDFGEAVVAVVVPAPGASPSEEEIVGGLGDRLARFKQPKRVFFVETLPRNTMGKVQKKILREAHAALFAPAARGG